MDVQRASSNMSGTKRKAAHLISNSDAKVTDNESGEGRKRKSARWDDFAHLKFVELCEQEIGKGSEPGTRLPRDGWRNLVTLFNELTGRNYSRKQLKNHWDVTRSDWLLFKQLIRGETELRWDETKNTIAKDDSWWEEKIKVNKNFKRFVDKDLSLFWFRYDNIFATGESARASSQVDTSAELGFTMDLEDEESDKYINEEQGIDGESKGSDDFNNFHEVGRAHMPETPIGDNTVFPRSTATNGRSRGRKSGGKTRKLRDAARDVACDVVHDVTYDIVYDVEPFRSIPRSSYSSESEPTVKQCMDMLKNISGVSPGTLLWNYSCNLLCNKDMRAIFVGQPSDGCRLSWLKFNHSLFSGDPPSQD